MTGLIEKKLASAAPARDPRQEQARQAMLQAFKHRPGSPEFAEQMRAALESVPHDAADEQKFAAWNEKMQAGQNDPDLFFSPASGRYRFTEFCVVPGREYNITGTCMENPEAKDEHDRNLISKGINEPTYLISDKTLVKVKSGLRNKALLMIFGGAGAAVVCLGFLLGEFGLF
jgi:hypothetical protein